MHFQTYFGTPPPHSGPALLHNFPRLKKLTQTPRHLGMSSQGKICRMLSEFNPIGFTSGLKIEFYIILALK